MKSIFPLLLSALFFVSCSRSMYYRPAASQPDVTDVIYTQGVPALRNSIQGCEVVAELTSRGATYMDLNLYIRNNSDSAFTFDPSGMEVHGYDRNGNRDAYRVFTAEQYIRHRDTRNAIIAGAVVVATVATVIAVSQNSGSSDIETPSRVTYDAVNFAYDLSWFLAWTIPMAAEEPPPAPPASSPDFLLRTHTLYPGEAVQGIVKLRANSEYDHKILVEVPVNGGYAQFVFDGAKQKF
ncbi:MAG: hypothetical protein KDC61_16760 [Saprospiraceae bacterium]|nr:hypothetical protein [Saprospiraceae bacterium]